MSKTTNITSLLQDGSRESRGRVLRYYMAKFRRQAASLIKEYNIRRSDGTDLVVQAAMDKGIFSREKPFVNRQQFEAVFYQTMNWRALTIARNEGKDNERYASGEAGEIAIQHTSASSTESAELRTVAHHLRRLDAELLEVVLLKLAGVTDAEIAGSQGVSERTVQNRWASARAELKRRIEAEME